MVNTAGSVQEVESYHQIDQDMAKQMMTRDDGHVIVDARRQDEYDAGHIPGAILIPNESIEAERPEELPDLDQIILIYCRSGNRSKQAAQKLADMGYTNIYEFGGINTWSGEIVTGETTMEIPENIKTIYLAGGCFWGTQKFFDQFVGVIRTEAGYANGPDEAPTYQDVCNSSGHAETVRVDYDPAVISLTDLLNYYFMVIDPLSVNKQGNDRGIQYRTGIYYTEEDQLPEIEAVYRAEEEKAGARLAVELLPLENFFPQKSITRSIWTRIPAATAISRAVTLIFSKTAQKNLQMNFGCGSAIWPLRSHSTPPRSTPSPASMTTSLKRAFMSTLSAANRFLHPWTSIV